MISSAPRIWYSKRWVKYFVRGKIYVISSAPRIWYSKRWVKYFVRGKIYVISSCDSVLLPHTQTNQYRTRVIPFICHIYICIPVILYMYTGHFIYVYRSYYICILGHSKESSAYLVQNILSIFHHVQNILPILGPSILGHSKECSLCVS